jgi:hypothetical protein
MPLADYTSAIDDLVRDKDQVLSSGSIQLAIAQALLVYSDHRPREVPADVVADAAGYELQLPAGWVVDFSVVRAIEYPVDQNPVAMLDMARVYRRLRPAGERIELPVALSAGDVVRVTYSATHVVDNATDTVPPAHRHAVQCLAASNLCGQLASYYATEAAPTIGADVSDHQGKTERFRARARDLVAVYNSVLGIATGGKGGDVQAKSAGTVVTLDSLNAAGEQRLFHGHRYPRRRN